MFTAFQKIISGFIAIGFFLTAGAQSNQHFVKGSFSENVFADVLVSKVGKDGYQRVASYTISPNDKAFAIALPDGAGTTYRMQINLMNPPGTKPKLIRICAFSLSMKPGQNYTLNITPSELDTAKKKGWELKADASTPALALVTGNLLHANGQEPLGLQRVEDGDLVSNNSFTVSRAGEFTVPYPVVKEGFYYLSSPRWRVRVYLTPSEKLQLSIDDRSGLVTTLQGSAVNQWLHQWQQLIVPVTAYGYNQTEVNAGGLDTTAYFKMYQQLQPSMDSFAGTLPAHDAHLVKIVSTAMQVDRELAPLNLLNQLLAEQQKSPGSGYKAFADVPAFYKQFVKANKFNEAAMLSLGEAKPYMDLYAKLNLSLVPVEKRERMSKGEKLQLMMACFNNDTLKAIFLKDQLEQQVVNNLSEFRETFAPYQSYTRFVPVKKAYDQVYQLFSSDTAFVGKAVSDIRLPDTSGRLVSMKDLKGKVVFVDVWASWCSPCKKEFPFLKEIEEEYHDNPDLVFVGISIDKAEQKQQWLQTIRKEKLAGVQLLDEGGAGFAHRYGITSIPRFLLLDKQGRWIEVRCPRPTAKEELKRYLNAALGEPTAVTPINDNASSMKQ